MNKQNISFFENATRDLACFSAQLCYDDIPAEAVERMKTSLLDSIGCCLYGATLPWTQRVQAMVEAEQAAPVASLCGAGRKTSIANAVLVNGTAGHAFELDDIHKESIVHPGSIVTPIVLAYAERDGNWTGRDLITAMVAGYEVGTRVGNAATMSLFYRGFHPQGTSGVFVAAGTAAKALGLNADRTLHTLGIAGSQAGGLMAAQEGAMVKRFHSGRAAQSGVYSAELASRDFTGIADVLEAYYGGYLSSYSDKPDMTRLTDGLGKDWETAKVGYKPHASVTSIHAALDALNHIMHAHHLKAADIASIKAGVSHMTYVHCAWQYNAQSVTAAQMNLSYGLAVIAHDGMAFVDQYDEKRLADPLLLDLIKRIEAYEDEEIEAMGPAFRHAAVVTVMTRDGRRLTHRILNRRGSPENPISASDVQYKFRNVVRPCLTQAKIDRLVELSERLDSLDDVCELIAIVGAPRA